MHKMEAKRQPMDTKHNFLAKVNPKCRGPIRPFVTPVPESAQIFKTPSGAKKRKKKLKVRKIP